MLQCTKCGRTLKKVTHYEKRQHYVFWECSYCNEKSNTKERCREEDGDENSSNPERIQ